MNDQPIFAFLDFEFCRSSKALTRRGDPVSLRPKTLATLEYLLGNRARVVGKGELLDSIWSDTDVQEQAVFQSISELRAIFKGNHCIETVRGYGYRWVCPVQADHESLLRHSFRFKAALVTGFLVMAGIAWWQSAVDKASFTVHVLPAASATATDDVIGVASSLDYILVQQLRRMGWNARLSLQAGSNADVAAVAVEFTQSDKLIELDFTLDGGGVGRSGSIVSSTPLGAVRDLAAEIHGLLSTRSFVDSRSLSASVLFLQARDYLDQDNYRLAEAYLTVVLAEEPDNLSAKMALAYAYRQMGESRNAIETARIVHKAAHNPAKLTERMMSAMLLSQELTSVRQLSDSERFAHEAMGIASEIGDLLIVAEAQEQLGEIALARGQTRDGREKLMIALNYYQSFCPTGEMRVNERLRDLN